MSDRFRVVLAYDGTDFSGSQYQKDLRTVQGEVQNSLQKIGWQEDSVLFAGRTDAGVHAAGQVIAFDLKWDHTERELSKAINAVLPPDISARNITRTRQDFHPRYDARARKYQYRILINSIRDPLRERYSWRVWPEIELKQMKRAARYLIGTHDFRALGNPHQAEGSTIRRVEQAVWKKEGNELIFEITGNAFLYRMVRRITALLVKIGQGKEPPAAVRDYLQNPTGLPSQGLAPPNGLVLIEVSY